MAKETSIYGKRGQRLVSATGSSQDLTRKVSKTCRCIRRGSGVAFESGKDDLIMPYRRGHVQHDG